MLKNFTPTIIITSDPHEIERGYSLQGREFRLSKQVPVKDQGITLDNRKMDAEYWVISKSEYMRVCPEARSQDFDSDFIYIPTWAAKFSFRPSYLFK
jgi:hypothetical protein